MDLHAFLALAQHVAAAALEPTKSPVVLLSPAAEGQLTLTIDPRDGALPETWQAYTGTADALRADLIAAFTLRHHGDAAIMRAFAELCATLDLPGAAGDPYDHVDVEATERVRQRELEPAAVLRAVMGRPSPVQRPALTPDQQSLVEAAAQLRGECMGDWAATDRLSDCLLASVVQLRGAKEEIARLERELEQARDGGDPEGLRRELAQARADLEEWHRGRERAEAHAPALAYSAEEAARLARLLRLPRDPAPTAHQVAARVGELAAALDGAGKRLYPDSLVVDQRLWNDLLRAAIARGWKGVTSTGPTEDGLFALVKDAPRGPSAVSALETLAVEGALMLSASQAAQLHRTLEFGEGYTMTPADVVLATEALASRLKAQLDRNSIGGALFMNNNHRMRLQCALGLTPRALVPPEDIVSEAEGMAKRLRAAADDTANRLTDTGLPPSRRPPSRGEYSFGVRVIVNSPLGMLESAGASDDLTAAADVAVGDVADRLLATLGLTRALDRRDIAVDVADSMDPDEDDGDETEEGDDA